MLYIELLKIFSGSEKFQVHERLNRKDGDCPQSIFEINTFNSGVKCKEEGDLIVTSHASKAYDIGCISIRKMVTPTELTVVWSAYQVKLFHYSHGKNKNTSYLILQTSALLHE